MSAMVDERTPLTAPPRDPEAAARRAHAGGTRRAAGTTNAARHTASYANLCVLSGCCVVALMVLGVAKLGAPGVRRLYLDHFGDINDVSPEALAIMNCNKAVNRVQPSVYLLGVQKCGTTSMYGDIMSHLNLKPAWQTNTHHSQKEVHFFDQDENQAAIVGEGELTGWNNHLDKHNAACSSTGFELDEEMAKKGDDFDPKNSDTKYKIIDATPNYYYSEKAAEAIYKATGSKEENAKLRFVVMLCDPVSRLESAYVFFRGRCEAAHNCQSDGPYKHINYAGWVDELLHRYPTDIEDAGGDPTKLKGSLYHQVSSSMYAEHLAEWTKHYDPSQFLVIPSYYYYADPQNALHEVAAHVGSKVDATIGSAKHANNYPSKERLIGKVSATNAEGIKAIFKPHMVKLRETMCALQKKGLNIGSWADAEKRKKYWFFMPEEALKDC